MKAVQKKTGIIIVLLHLFCFQYLFPAAVSAGFDRGQALYENHCMSCHESWAHTRDGRHVASLSDLRKRVQAWSIHIGLGWKDEEIDDVTDYLNRHYYTIDDEPDAM